MKDKIKEIILSVNPGMDVEDEILTLQKIWTQWIFLH